MKVLANGRIFKGLALYCGLSLLLAPVSILFIQPNVPASLLGWVIFLALPVPFTVAGEWFRERLDQADMPAIDSLGMAINRSPYKLLITVTLVAAAGGFGLGIIFLLTTFK